MDIIELHVIQRALVMTSSSVSNNDVLRFLFSLPPELYLIYLSIIVSNAQLHGSHNISIKLQSNFFFL